MLVEQIDYVVLNKLVVADCHWKAHETNQCLYIKLTTKKDGCSTVFENVIVWWLRWHDFSLASLSI